MKTWTHIFLVFLLFCKIKRSYAGITDLWDFCGCRWNEWQTWSDCNAECNGQRVRERSVKLYTNKDGCIFAFSTCASSDMAYDYSRCNSFCHNGGTSNSYSCSCITGYYGTCCGHQINCGDPGSLSNGHLHGSAFTYGITVTYSCNIGYLLVGGSKSRICQITHTWSGSKPRCAYFDSCSSGPCNNGATCSNIPDDYTCECNAGWSGKNCEVDIQPPLVANCSENISVEVSELEVTIEWEIPNFWDFRGLFLEISSNYPTNAWIFPWGDFKVIYTALKPSNGLKTECLFDIKIRPHPCRQLAVPMNGAILCNNWKTDFGKICTHLCNESFTVARGIEASQWFVCGATGSWKPSSYTPNCTVNTANMVSSSVYKFGDTFKSCESEIQELQMLYIIGLKGSPFKYFCENYIDECKASNVLVLCH